jgi:hypothetical protein
MANEVRLDEVSQKVFGMSARNYRRMAKEHPNERAEIYIPEPQKGLIPFVVAVRGLISYYRKLSESHGSLSLTDERRELVRVQRQLKEIELLVKKGELIPKDIVSSLFLERIAFVKPDLVALDKRLNAQLEGKNFRERAPILKKYGRGLLEKYSARRGILK